MAIERLLTRYIWLKFSHDQRMLMRKSFAIPKSGGVVMTGNVMESDGSNENDLRAVNVSSMQVFLEYDKEDDFDKLLNLTVEKIDQMLASEKEEKDEQARSEEISKRAQEIDDVVDTILETINNLPIDAQMKIKVALSHIGETDEHNHVSTSTRNSKGKKASDK